MGWDAVTDSPLISLDGHLGRVKDGAFVDVITKALYFDIFKFPWDLQKTAFGYLSAVDQLTGSSLKKTFLEAFDENGDGVVSYSEKGQKGVGSIGLYMGGYSTSCLGAEPLGFISGRVKTQMKRLKLVDPRRNSHGYDFLKESSLGGVCLAAFRMSQIEMERPDPFVPGLTFGKGKWPSFQTAQFFSLGLALYGQGFPFQTGFPSLYGAAVYYADLTQREGKYLGGSGRLPDPERTQAICGRGPKGPGPAYGFHLLCPPRL